MQSLRMRVKDGGLLKSLGSCLVNVVIFETNIFTSSKVLHIWQIFWLRHGLYAKDAGIFSDPWKFACFHLLNVSFSGIMSEGHLPFCHVTWFWIKPMVLRTWLWLLLLFSFSCFCFPMRIFFTKVETTILFVESVSTWRDKISVLAWVSMHGGNKEGCIYFPGQMAKLVSI